MTARLPAELSESILTLLSGTVQQGLSLWHSTIHMMCVQLVIHQSPYPHNHQQHQHQQFDLSPPSPLIAMSVFEPSTVRMLIKNHHPERDHPKFERD